jgi:hypothetical protein
VDKKIYILNYRDGSHSEMTYQDMVDWFGEDFEKDKRLIYEKKIKSDSDIFP